MPTMPIVGHGIDIVETSRIRRLHEDHGQHFLDRCFTPLEQAYCSRITLSGFITSTSPDASRQKRRSSKSWAPAARGGIAWTRHGNPSPNPPANPNSS